MLRWWLQYGNYLIYCVDGQWPLVARGQFLRGPATLHKQKYDEPVWNAETETQT